MVLNITKLVPPFATLHGVVWGGSRRLTLIVRASVSGVAYEFCMKSHQIWKRVGSDDLSEYFLTFHFSEILFYQSEVLLVNAHFKAFRGHKLHYDKLFHHKTFLECLLCVKPFLSFLACIVMETTLYSHNVILDINIQSGPV